MKHERNECYHTGGCVVCNPYLKYPFAVTVRHPVWELRYEDENGITREEEAHFYRENMKTSLDT